MSVNAKLIAIQNKLIVPKGKKNQFGGFNYRSVEDILMAVKPLCAEQGLLLTITDDVEEKGNYIYITSTATVEDEEGGKKAVKGWARDPLEKKGMDAAQVTGTSSSYARKRALGGLFLIDDEVDTDSLDNRTQESKGNQSLIVTLSKMCEAKNVSVSDFCQLTFGKKPDACTDGQLRAAIDRFNDAFAKYQKLAAVKNEEIPM